MKSGRIEQYAHLSPFTSVKQFNKSINRAIQLHGHKFTKGEKIAFLKLTQYSVKTLGVCNARICKLVQATQTDGCGISRSTFERMLRKAKQFGILTTHHTTREKGGYSHNVYIFTPFDGACDQQLTYRPTAQTPAKSSPTPRKSQPETKELKATKKTIKNHRPITSAPLDASFVPAYVPQAFVKVVNPFFNEAIEITALWDRATIAYRALAFDEPLEAFLPTIISAFKETVFQYKRRRIRTSFTQYFYGTASAMLATEKRKLTRDKQPTFANWLD